MMVQAGVCVCVCVFACIHVVEPLYGSIRLFCRYVGLTYVGLSLGPLQQVQRYYCMLQNSVCVCVCVCVCVVYVFVFVFVISVRVCV